MKEKFKFKVDNEVIFIDDPKGTSLSLNGRKGRVERPIIMNITHEIYYGVKWDNKEHEFDDAYTNVAERCLCLYDENDPMIYALHMLYKGYHHYENPPWTEFTSDEISKLDKARAAGLLNDILGVDT